MYQCPTCERGFETRRGLGVHHSAVHDERLPNRTCGHCGARFYAPHEKRYCSEACRLEGGVLRGSEHPNWQGGPEETACERCGSTFEYYPSDKDGRYCPECVEAGGWRFRPNVTGKDHPRWTGGKREFACSKCGAMVRRHPWNATSDRVFCGPDCQYEWLSEAFTGEGHPNWAGGPVGDYGPGWRRARERTLERDDHACVICGVTREELGRNPDVHHVVPVRAFLEEPLTTVGDAHYPENLVSLCPPCHRRAEFGAVARGRLAAIARDRVG